MANDPPYREPYLCNHCGLYDTSVVTYGCEHCWDRWRQILGVVNMTHAGVPDDKQELHRNISAPVEREELSDVQDAMYSSVSDTGNLARCTYRPTAYGDRCTLKYGHTGEHVYKLYNNDELDLSAGADCSKPRCTHKLLAERAKELNTYDRCMLVYGHHGEHAYEPKADQKPRYSKYLSYAAKGNTLIVTHPDLCPHEIVHAEGQWYCYPISPDLPKVRSALFNPSDAYSRRAIEARDRLFDKAVLEAVSDGPTPTLDKLYESMWGDEDKAVKFDTDKTQYHLIPIEGIDELARLYCFGASKYSADNWKTGKGLGYKRCFNAMLRHLFAWFCRKEDIDSDSGCHHLAAVAFYCFGVIYWHKTGSGEDDR